MTPFAPTDLLQNIRHLILEARKSVLHYVNLTMVATYFEIGRRIVEDEQNGNERADYAEKTLEKLSKELVAEFGKGFSATNLRQMRHFYLIYGIQQMPSAESFLSSFVAQGNISWSHYLVLMRITNAKERRFYEIETVANNWSVKELKRQFDASLYERLALSRDQEKVHELSEKGQVLNHPEDTIKDPLVLDFLGFDEKSYYSESEFEQAILDKLQHFLLELGKGFSFVARQQRISFDERHFRVDLVFYNRFLRCFLLIDLKKGDLSHQDLGQMQMYVNYYDREIKMPEENKTVGLILCKDKSDALVEYTLPEDNEQIFASRYLTILPDKALLQKLLA